MSDDGMDLQLPDVPLATLQRDALNEAIRCLEEVRTGGDFEVECWSAASILRQTFDIPYEDKELSGH